MKARKLSGMGLVYQLKAAECRLGFHGTDTPPPSLALDSSPEGGGGAFQPANYKPHTMAPLSALTLLLWGVLANVIYTLFNRSL